MVQGEGDQEPSPQSTVQKSTYLICCWTPLQREIWKAATLLKGIEASDILTNPLGLQGGEAIQA